MSARLDLAAVSGDETRTEAIYAEARELEAEAGEAGAGRRREESRNPAGGTPGSRREAP